MISSTKRAHTSWLAITAVGLCTFCAAPPSPNTSKQPVASEPPAPAATPSRAIVGNPVRASNASAPEETPIEGALLQGVTAVNDRTVLITFKDGTATQPTLGKGTDGSVEFALLDVVKAVEPSSYRITSSDDPRYASAQQPSRVGRKSKSADIINAGATVWIMKHQIAIVLPTPMQRGKKYAFDVGSLAKGKSTAELTFDDRSIRSEAIHANQVGYVPSAPLKFAYVSAWLGTLGPVSWSDYANRPFHVHGADGKAVLSGKPKLRKAVQGGQPDSGYNENFTRADVWELDFSKLNQPGKYRVCLEGVGCSYDFEVGANVYHPIYVATGRALYHQRCGTAIEAKYSPDFARPRCHHPEIRPMKQVNVRDPNAGWADDENGERSKKLLTGEVRPTAWGGYHDAGDWDREGYNFHMVDDLLLAYELAPQNFKDGDYNIPESGNGIPDIVDSAQWLVDYWRRLQRPNGGVSLGFRHDSYPRMGQTSWTDTMGWYIVSEDPAQSYKYAANAARLASVYKLLGKPAVAQTYIQSAVKAFKWAQSNTQPGDEAAGDGGGGKFPDYPVLAAAALFKATGDKSYEAIFKKGLKVVDAQTALLNWGKWDQDMAAYTYVTTAAPGVDAELQKMLKAAILGEAQRILVDTAQKRSMRFGYDWHKPTSWGALSHARPQPLMVAHYLTKDAKYLEYYYTTLDHQLGANPSNMVWVTGFGQESPRRLYHPDAWYLKNAEPIPGLIPMGPHKFEPGPAPGPWDNRFGMQTAYPPAEEWPVEEMWFENRYSPVTAEFVANDLAYATATYGYVLGR